MTIFVKLAIKKFQLLIAKIDINGDW